MTKSLHRLLMLLIFIFVSASAYLFFPNNKPPLPTVASRSERDPRFSRIGTSGESTILSGSSTPQINTQQEDIKPAIIKNRENSTAPNKKIETPQSTTTTSTIPDEQKPETVRVTIVISDKEYQTEVKPGSSAYEAMNNLKESGQISFSAKKFSGLGYFIEEINGIKNSPSTGFYWTLYINNQEAKVGVSGYILKPNDIIIWKYENK